MAASARSPYFIPSRKRRRPAAPIRAMPQAGMEKEAPPKALAKRSPQGRAHRMMPANRRKEIWVSPARMHRTSSGKKGNRKASTRKISVLAWITSRYFSETFRPTRRVTASRPRPRARENTSSDPVATAEKVSRKETQVPKSTPPARAETLLGMGARMTDRN